MEPRLRLNIDQLLKQNKLRASDLSKLTGIPKQTISEWRAGLVPKSVVALKRVASAFGVSLDELVFRAFGPEAALTHETPPDAQTGTPTQAWAGSWEELGLNSDFLITLDHQGHATFLTEAWARCLGWERAILLARPLIEFMALDGLEVGPVVERFLQKESYPLPQVFSFLTRDARIVSLEWQKVSVRNEQTALFLAKLDPRAALRADDRRHFSLSELVGKACEAFQAQPRSPTIRWHIEHNLPELTVQHRPNLFMQTVLVCLNQLSPLWIALNSPELSQPSVRWQLAADRVSLRFSAPPLEHDKGQDLLEFPQRLSHELGGLLRLEVDESGPALFLELAAEGALT